MNSQLILFTPDHVIRCSQMNSISLDESTHWFFICCFQGPVKHACDSTSNQTWTVQSQSHRHRCLNTHCTPFDPAAVYFNCTTHCSVLSRGCFTVFFFFFASSLRVFFTTGFSFFIFFSHIFNYLATFL